THKRESDQQLRYSRVHQLQAYYDSEFQNRSHDQRKESPELLFLGYASAFPQREWFHAGLHCRCAAGNGCVHVSHQLRSHGFADKFSKEFKPTFNTTFAWVSGNHSFKFGGDLIVDGIQTLNYTRANGVYGFAGQQSGIGTWENGRGLNGPTGFGLASFMMGRANSLAISQLTDSRLGNHSMAFYAQDSWKVTRKLP